MLNGQPALPSGRNSSASTRHFIAFLLLFIVCTRWATAPGRLYYFDSGNFALALEHFNPALHQPQPPGYPFFVLFIRLIHLFVASPERVLLVAGIVAAGAAVMLIRLLAFDFFGRPAGLLASALLASNPVFWFAGVTNQIRVFLALCTITVSVLAWRAVCRPEETRWFYGACAALGVAAGFRPVACALLLPLLFWVWWRSGRGPRRLAIAAGLLAGASVPWIAAIVIAVGGLQATINLLWDYATVQFHGSSAVFGAPALSAWLMWKEAVVWNFLGVFAWVWAVPLVLRRGALAEYRTHAMFLALAFLPQFLFSAVIHIGDPDQALGTISVLCVLGGGVLAALVRQTNVRALSIAAAVIAAQTLVFFVPFNKLSKASSYRTVAAVDRMNSGAIAAITALRRGQPITVVHYGSLVASRHLQFYFPDDYVVVLPGSPGNPAPSEPIQMFYQHSGAETGQPATARMAPHSRRLVCLLPLQARSSDLPGWHSFGPVYYLDRNSDKPVSIGPYTLIPDER